MISEWQVFDWLNHYSKSHLSMENAEAVRCIRFAQIPEAEKTNILLDLINFEPFLPTLNERAELRVICALLYYARGLRQEASRLLQSAQNTYEHIHDIHRQAITDWLLFIVYHGLGEQDTAFYWARQALANLWKLVKLWEMEKDEYVERWYRNLIFEITADLFLTPRYVYGSLFEFSPSRLKTSSKIIQEHINQLMKDQNYPEVHRQIERLQNLNRRALDTYETGEAFAYSGMVANEIGDCMGAVRLFGLAMAQFIPGSLAHTLVRWMLALILYPIQAEQCRAIEHMEQCVSCAQDLAKKADIQNLQVMNTWYKTMQESMLRVMERKVATPVEYSFPRFGRV